MRSFIEEAANTPRASMESGGVNQRELLVWCTLLNWLAAGAATATTALPNAVMWMRVVLDSDVRGIASNDGIGLSTELVITISAATWRLARICPRWCWI